MAKFCTGCGSPMEEAQQFCTKCGAQAGVPPAPTAGPPQPAPIAAAPPKKPSPVLKIVLVVAGVFVLLCVIAIASVVYVGYRVKQRVQETITVDEAGTSVTIETPEGPFVIGEGEEGEAAAAATADVPPYPNSNPTEDGGRMAFGGRGGISVQEYETSDSVDQVVAFYKEKLGSKIQLVRSDETAVVSFSTDEATTTISITRNEEDELTQITISRMGK